MLPCHFTLPRCIPISRLFILIIFQFVNKVIFPLSFHAHLVCSLVFHELFKVSHDQGIGRAWLPGENSIQEGASGGSNVKNEKSFGFTRVKLRGGTQQSWWGRSTLPLPYPPPSPSYRILPYLGMKKSGGGVNSFLSRCARSSSSPCDDWCTPVIW